MTFFVYKAADEKMTLQSNGFSREKWAWAQRPQGVRANATEL